jgi:sialidase-1
MSWVAATWIALASDVFVGGQGGYPVYRIPAALRLEGAPAPGRIVAMAEARGSMADVGSNDLVMRTSDDGGATWSPQRTVLHADGRSMNNPCLVQPVRGPHAGRLILMAQSYPERCDERCVEPGFDAGPGGDRVCRTLVAHSDDAGATWCAPREVTRRVKRAEGVTSTATGPGIGIQLAHGPHAGRILMPFNEGPFDRWRVYAAISDDGGDTWSMGEPAPVPGPGRANEVQFFERQDGTVVLNARQHLGARRRTTAESRDGGLTWSPLADVPELPDPQCMGGIVALGGGTVVFTGCDSESRRALGTAWVSRDDGRTWPTKVAVEPGGFAYSVPVALGAGRVGVLHEAAGYARISFRIVELPPAQP